MGEAISLGLLTLSDHQRVHLPCGYRSVTPRTPSRTPPNLSASGAGSHLSRIVDTLRSSTCPPSVRLSLSHPSDSLNTTATTHCANYIDHLVRIININPSSDVIAHVITFNSIGWY